MTASAAAPSPTPASALASDPRSPFARAVTIATTVVAAVEPEHLGRSTPCTEFDVRTLLGHLVFVLRRVAAIGRCENAMAPPPGIEGVADSGWLDAWNREVAALNAAWTDPAALEQTVTLPFATFSGAAALGMYTGELTLHTWDLATAIGMRPPWDDDVLTVAFAAIAAQLPPDGRTELYAEIARKLGQPLAAGTPFAEAVPVAADAPLIDRLVAYAGRQP